jgi:hypothetical protein
VEKELAHQAWQIQRQAFMPMAFRWRTPDVDDDPPTPPLENSFAQPAIGAGLERFSYRLNTNGELEFKGHLDMSGGAAFGTVALTLPEPVGDEVEPSYRNSRLRVEGYTVNVTSTGGLAGVALARAVVDPDTGEVTIEEIGGFRPPWVRRRYTGATLICGDANDVNVTYNDGGDPDHASVDGSDDWQSYFEFETAGQTQLLVAGQIIHSGKFRWDSPPAATRSWIILNDGGLEPEIVSYMELIGEITSYNQAFTFKHNYPLGETFLIQMAQDSTPNAARTLDRGYHMLTYLGAYTGPDLNDPDDLDPVE